MGEQTTVVLVAYVVTHVALILSVIGVSTPVWVKGELNSTLGNDGDENVTTKGLWYICEFGECSRLNQTAQTGEFLAVQITYTLGSVLLFIGTLGIYAYTAIRKFHTCKKIALANILNMNLAFGCVIAAVVIFGQKEYEATADVEGELSLGWSYWCAVAGVVFTCFSVVAAAYRYKVIARRNSGYEDL